MFQELLLKTLVSIIGKLLTPEVVKAAEKSFVQWLQAQAASSDSKIDDEIVKILAEALGIDLTIHPV